MVKVITQETFDAVVKENVEEFGMEMAEAVKDAKEQFEKQGINLGNIVLSEKGSQVVVDAVKELFKDLSDDEIVKELHTIQENCKDDLAQRVLATNNGAYSVLIKLCQSKESQNLQEELVKTLVSVMTTNPDMLESQGIDAINKILGKHQDDSLCLQTLKLVLICSLKCEENRVALIQSGVLSNLSKCISSSDPEIVIMVARVWVAMVQDDDVRVPFGKAHENAREIVENHDGLKLLTSSLEKHNSHLKALEACLSGIRALAVRNEYCQEVVDEGGLKHVQTILINYPQEADVVMKCLQVIKALAGNDKVKTDAGREFGILPLVVTSMDRHVTRAGLVEAGCSAITSLTLRQSDNSCQVVKDCDGAVILTLVMSKHPTNRKVQSAAAAAIRNIVSRNKELCAAFIERGVEQLLSTAMEHHREKIGDTIRSAQRDLGLKVELVESWTGDKIKISEDFRESEDIPEK